MVLYFSGTGNSQYVAEVIASELGDELISINGINISENAGTENILEGKAKGDKIDTSERGAKAF